MPSLNVIINGSSQPFERELQKVSALAATSARNVASTMARASQYSLTGIIRESVVIGREIAMGRGGGRIAGSFTLLYQYLRGLTNESGKAASAARLVSDAYEQAALKAAMLAQASLRKAQAAEAAFFEEGAESEATAVGADADRAKAAADMEVAMTTRAKATAAAQAAEAEEAEAIATGEAAESSFFAVTGAGLLTAGLAALAIAAVVVYEKFHGLKEAIKEADFNLPEIKDSYIPMMKRHINDAKNAQREVTNEVRKTEEAYNSASAAAKRTADATKEHYGHLEKMMEIRKATELASAHSPAAKLAIEKKYSDQALQLQKDRQNEEMLNNKNDVANLTTESRTKLQAANSIKVNTKEEDQKNLGQLNTNAEAAEAFLKGGDTWKHFKENAAILFGGNPLGMKKRQQLILDTEQRGKESAQQTIATRNKYADTVTGNDVLRSRKGELVDQAAKAAAEAAAKSNQMVEDKKKNDQANKDAKEEADAKLAQEAAEGAVKKHSGGRQLSINSQQRIGAYARSGFDKDTALLERIAKGIDKLHGPAHKPVADKGTTYAGIHQ